MELSGIIFCRDSLGVTERANLIDSKHGGSLEEWIPALRQPSCGKGIEANMGLPKGSFQIKKTAGKAPAPRSLVNNPRNNAFRTLVERLRRRICACRLPLRVSKNIYPTAAQLMNHTYLGIQNGRVIDRDMVARHDVELRRHPTRREAQHAPVEESMRAFEEQGKPAIRALIQTAFQELGIR